MVSPLQAPLLFRLRRLLKCAAAILQMPIEPWLALAIMVVWSRIHPRTPSAAEAALIAQTICAAVRTRQLLRINYHHASTVVQPCALKADDDGNPCLVAWELNGKSPGLKRFALKDVSGASPL
jgi:hypothetical protein